MAGVVDKPWVYGGCQSSWCAYSFLYFHSDGTMLFVKATTTAMVDVTNPNKTADISVTGTYCGEWVSDCNGLQWTTSCGSSSGYFKQNGSELDFSNLNLNGLPYGSLKTYHWTAGMPTTQAAKNCN